MVRMNMRRWIRQPVLGFLATVGGVSLLIVCTPVAHLLACPLNGITSSPPKANVTVVLFEWW